MSDKRKNRSILNLSAIKENENFQNSIMRPTLKLQHEIIIDIFIFFIRKNRIDIFKNTSNDFYVQLVETLIGKNLPLRNQLLGIVIGQFDKNEFNIYAKNVSEFNKRIVTMIKQRLCDSEHEIRIKIKNNR